MFSSPVRTSCRDSSNRLAISRRRRPPSAPTVRRALLFFATASSLTPPALNLLAAQCHIPAQQATLARAAPWPRSTPTSTSRVVCSRRLERHRAR